MYSVIAYAVGRYGRAVFFACAKGAVILAVVLALKSEAVMAETGSTKLLPPPNGIYHAAFPDFGPEEDIVTARRLDDFFDELSGKKITWAYFSNNWFRGIRFPKGAVETIRSKGSIPFIRMMSRSNWNDGCSDRKYRLQKIIDGKFDKKLRAYAQAAKAVPGPLIIEFGTEVNGDWFPWSGHCNGGATTGGFGDPAVADGPERFRAAYRHIIDLFRSQDVRNVTWMLHLNAYGASDEPWNSFKAYYPGDDYIDWIGVSVYGAQTPRELRDWNPTFREVMDYAYPRLAAISRTKPIAVLEFGVVEYKGKATWIASALNDLSNGRYPRIKAISYWHSDWDNFDGTWSRMRIDSSPSALAAYRQSIADPAFVVAPIISR